MNPNLLLDFGDNNVFENANVLTDILVATKGKNTHNTLAAIVPTVKREDLPKAMSEAVATASQQSFQCCDVWVISDPTARQIKKKMEDVGKSLAARGYWINRGILTGRNNVFIISTEKRNEILAACKDEEERNRTEKIIRKIIRGEDISRNKVSWDNIWVINTHNGLKDENRKTILERIHIEDNPTLKAYLDEHMEEIKHRYDQGDTPYNLRSCTYLRDFDKDKIVWGNLNLKASFAMDTEKCIVNAPANQIVPASRALLNLLNSSLADWYIRQLGVTRNGGYFEYKPMFVGQLPIPEDISSLENLSDEKQIDKEVFRLYGLSDEEANYIQLMESSK